jgi:hypothetical protein
MHVSLIIHEKPSVRRTFAVPPRKVPKRIPRNGSSDVAGPQALSSANWIGMAASELFSDVRSRYSEQANKALTDIESRIQMRRS